MLLSKYDQLDWIPIFCSEFYILLLLQYFEGAQFSIQPTGETKQQKPCEGNFIRARSFINKKDGFYLWGSFFVPCSISILHRWFHNCQLSWHEVINTNCYKIWITLYSNFINDATPKYICFDFVTPCISLVYWYKTY